MRKGRLTSLVLGGILVTNILIQGILGSYHKARESWFMGERQEILAPHLNWPESKPEDKPVGGEWYDLRDNRDYRYYFVSDVPDSLRIKATNLEENAREEASKATKNFENAFFWGYFE